MTEDEFIQKNLITPLYLFEIDSASAVTYLTKERAARVEAELSPRTTFPLSNPLKNKLDKAVAAFRRKHELSFALGAYGEIEVVTEHVIRALPCESIIFILLDDASGADVRFTPFLSASYTTTYRCDVGVPYLINNTLAPSVIKRHDTVVDAMVIRLTTGYHRIVEELV